MSTRRIAATAVVALLTLTGCKAVDDTSGVTSANEGLRVMGDGHHTITKGMRGFWKTEGAPGCEWAKVDRYGNPTGDGKGNTTQRVMFGSADVGGFFLSDNCRAWSKK